MTEPAAPCAAHPSPRRRLPGSAAAWRWSRLGRSAGPPGPAWSARASRPPLPEGRRLTGRPALLLLASLIVALLAASAAPTPLYAIYQARWNFTPITTTVVFGVYAVAVLASLLTLGKLSDHVGRRPVLLAALAVQAASLLVFATADGVPALLAARVVQGLATGAALGAIGAGLLDVDRERGTFANAVAPGMGTGSGVLLSALAIRFLPAPTHLIYLALMGVFVLQAAGVVLLRETVSRKPGALASLRPEIRLPRTLRRPVLTAAPVLFAVWALAGLYGALGPSLVQALTGSADVVLGGLSLFVLTLTAVLAIVVLRHAAARTVMLTGILTLITGVALTMAGAERQVRARVLRRHRDQRGRVRQRLPGRHPHCRAPGRRARARRGAVLALHRVLPGPGTACGDRRIPDRARARADRYRPVLRRRGHPARRARPARRAGHPHRSDITADAGAAARQPAA